MREADQEAVARVSEERLWRRHMEMAQIGAIPGNGVNRAALSREDIAARGVLIGWARDRKFEVGVDAIGNLFVRRPGHDAAAAPVMTGSHLDSQPRGGRFDGVYGVLAGLEALQAIDEAGVKTRRPIELVAWTNEEGGRFPPCTMGSPSPGAAPARASRQASARARPAELRLRCPGRRGSPAACARLYTPPSPSCTVGSARLPRWSRRPARSGAGC